MGGLVCSNQVSALLLCISVYRSHIIKLPYVLAPGSFCEPRRRTACKHHWLFLSTVLPQPNFRQKGPAGLLGWSGLIWDEPSTTGGWNHSAVLQMTPLPPRPVPRAGTDTKAWLRLHLGSKVTLHQEDSTGHYSEARTNQADRRPTLCRPSINHAV